MSYYRHLKKPVEFATDFLLLSLFLSIIGISFWTAYRLNPRPAKETAINSFINQGNTGTLAAGINSIKETVVSNNNFLGLTVDGNSDEPPGLTITNIAVQDFKMMVLMKDTNQGNSLSIRIQDLVSREITRNILQISNPASQTRTLNFIPGIPDSYLQGMRYQLLINGKEYLLFDSNINRQPQNFYAVFPPGGKATVTLKISSQEAIAYPMDFHIDILEQ